MENRDMQDDRAAAPATTDDVAIIGVSGRYPGAEDIKEFWRNLSEGRHSVRPVPADRWSPEEHRRALSLVEGSPAPLRGAFLDEVDRFDALFFNISPNEAALMDPQERLFLETCWHLMESAGYTRAKLQAGNPVGVFVGAMNSTYEWIGGEVHARGRMTSANSSFWSIANRVSYFFDLTGPSMAVDTACSSSLTAVHLACESLRRGESRAAIAGGVNLVLHPKHVYRLNAAGMLSPDGVCRSFGAGANGFVVGEGVGAVLLKRMADARNDGDRVWAVIKGSATNSDGKTNGFTVPNPRAQSAVIRDGLRAAGLEAETISYVEAHGTGTLLGDPIEVAGLSGAFGGGVVPGRARSAR